jgi:hypothetical protein
MTGIRVPVKLDTWRRGIKDTDIINQNKQTVYVSKV